MGRNQGTEGIVRTDDDRIDELEAAMVENLTVIECPLRHFFTPGLYAREVTLPAGALVTSKIHKTEHPFTVSKGKLKIRVDDEEWVSIEAPYTGITKAGTRRVALIEEETIWTTYHSNPTDTQDLDELEGLIIEDRDNPIIGSYSEIKKIEQ